MQKQALNQALFIAVNFSRNIDFKEDLEEGLLLAKSGEFELLATMTFSRTKPDSIWFVGSGQALEIQALVNELKPDLVIINHNLSPNQERTLERLLSVPVVDRTWLILDIFAKNANTHEAYLQVELAKQDYLKNRLVRRWTHLERQRGGKGFLAGSGEKQIELDKRSILDKITKLKKRLDKVVAVRESQRSKRIKAGMQTVSIVGYTNSGKSTLFNLLTKANTLAENKLFATLEATTRHLFINSELEVLVSDTVGFIRDLPHKLVAAFRSTLEETVKANLLLHIVNCGNPNQERQIENVNLVLAEIKANNIPQLLVYNKIDLNSSLAPKIVYDELNNPQAVYISALHNIGIDLLKQAIVEKINFIIKNNYYNNQFNQDIAYEPWKNI